MKKDEKLESNPVFWIICWLMLLPVILWGIFHTGSHDVVVDDRIFVVAVLIYFFMIVRSGIEDLGNDGKIDENKTIV